MTAALVTKRVGFVLAQTGSRGGFLYKHKLKDSVLTRSKP